MSSGSQNVHHLGPVGSNQFMSSPWAVSVCDQLLIRKGNKPKVYF